MVSFPNWRYNGRCGGLATPEFQRWCRLAKEGPFGSELANTQCGRQTGRPVRFARLLHIVGFAADAANLRVAGIADDPELCGQHDLVALAFNRAPDEFFVLVRPVDVGGIEKMDA